MIITTPFSGSEIFCLSQKAFSPGNLVLGNSVHPFGARSTANYRGVNAFPGSEIEQASQFIATARESTLLRMLQAAEEQKVSGVISINNQIIFSAATTEFLCSGGALHTYESSQAFNQNTFFSAAMDGQAMFACLDAYYFPVAFTFGNVVFTNGSGRAISRKLNSLKKGEVVAYTDLFTQTRQLALNRLLLDAKNKGGQIVTGIKATINVLGDLNEMLLTGTACKRADESSQTTSRHSFRDQTIASSGLSHIEMWNMAKMGYVPKSLVLASTVYSLGSGTNLNVLINSFGKRELRDVTTILSEARAQVIAKLQHEAKKHQADKVVNLTIYTNSLGKGLFEFLAIGTALHKTPESKTYSEQLPQQAIMVDEITFYSANNYPKYDGKTLTANPLLRVILSIFVVIFIVFMVIGFLKTT